MTTAPSTVTTSPNDVVETEKGVLEAPAVTEPKNDESGGGDEAAYLDGWLLVSLASVLMAGAFMMALDNTILATAIPQITSDFNSLNDIGWYGAAYLITQMALLPTCGRIYTVYNVKWSYIVLLLVFELGSIICATAQNSITLIVGRAIAGFGAAGLMSGGAVIVSHCVALRKRAIIMGMFSMIFGIGGVTGPLIGGVITDNKTLTWRFCFWLNLPIGAIGLVQVWFTLKNPPPAVKGDLPTKDKIRQLDLPGATILIGGITCLLLALQWGGIVYPWSNSKIYGCLIGFGLIVILFFILQWKIEDSCTIPLHIFRSRTVCVACGFMMFLQLANVVQSYYWPIYFQSVKGNSAKESGVFTLPFVIASVISTLSVGWIISKIGYYVPFMWVGPPIIAVGGGLFQLLDSTSPTADWIGFQIVSALGYGVSTQIPLLSVQVKLNKEDVPTGCVMVLFCQALGGALGTSIAQNIFTDGVVEELQRIEGVDVAAVVAAGAKDYRRFIHPELLSRVIDAFGVGLKHTFWLSVASALIAVLISTGMEWGKVPLDKNKKRSEDTPA